ncbi:MAG TPA: guanylate cyclase [Flavobacteriaceae bacterium]|nr:guanylate cyclase [Flavobacteriaceae bacterium]
MINNELQNIFNGMTESIISKEQIDYDNIIERSSSISVANESSSIADSITAEDLSIYPTDEFSKKLKKNFRKLVGKKQKYEETIGTHPDFKHLEKTNDSEQHYIVSMFVDIKNSTSIYLKTKDLIRTKYIKNTMLRIITIFMQVFDGHIHRLQGDAVFSYFGWKDKCEEDAIIDSLNAASFLLYYIENELNQQLEKQQLSPIKLRIGIDFGEQEEVLWSEYGLPGSTEVTTTSLHTDLAAKLQNQASANSIMIGDNIKTFLDLPAEFITKKTYQENGEKKEKDYILKKPEKYYKMWVFQHKNYLKYFPFLENKSYSMICTTNGSQYFPNISALDKRMELNFHLYHPLTIPPRGINNIRFEWSKENRGKEAKDNKSEGRLAANKTKNNIAEEGTLFRGHHIMKCKTFQNGRVQNEIKFGIFIK